ncbi:DUF2225 domain-containing protein [Calidifontibacillus oryziterrae]|uniref:DUF2225 domain-containing protein n=1 Tax=Calidifontibacillus oryziterrae TaxID=1191699 RepID=UPI00030F3C1F|nr:DUF2225 domain-containing protein [Calidifontibacillus oryziterrae]
MSDNQLAPLYDKHETCALCKSTFTSKKIRSRFIKLDHTDTDLCPYYKDEEISPLLYFVKVCPKCGYSYSDHFGTYFPEGTRDAIENLVSAKWVPHNYGEERTVQQAIQTYKLALYCATLKKEKAIVLASLLIRLAWLYRKAENIKEERRFLELAVEKFNESYLEAYYSNTDMTEIRVMYLLGELNRRLGNYDKAVAHFSKVVDQQNSTLEKKVVDMAREQWYTTRDLMKKEQEEEAPNVES